MAGSEDVTIHTPDGVALDATIVRAAASGARLIVLVHGITVDKEEEGMFRRLATALAGAGFDSLRFSFRGHGHSSLLSVDMTISGEMTDLKSVVGYAESRLGGVHAAVASSFGAVSTSLLGKYLQGRIQKLVLWNPVLNLDKTFIHPSVSWGVKNFTGKNVVDVYQDGSFLIDDEFRVGLVFWEELHNFRPDLALTSTDFPVLILHGDQDTYVPFATSAELARSRPRTDLINVASSDHGFSTPEAERFAIERTVDFLSRPLRITG